MKKDQYKKMVKTTIERHGKDFYSRIGKHDNKPRRGDSEYMKNLVNLRWEKYRKQKEEQNGGN